MHGKKKGLRPEAQSQAAGGRRLPHRTFSALPLHSVQQSAGLPQSSPTSPAPTTSRRHKRPHAPVGGSERGPGPGRPRCRAASKGWEQEKPGSVKEGEHDRRSEKVLDGRWAQGRRKRRAEWGARIVASMGWGGAVSRYICPCLGFAS